MQQFNNQFIEYHLVPFLQNVLKDVVQKPFGGKSYHEAIFEDFLSPDEKKNFEQDYFIKNKNSNKVPFTREDERPERLEFIETLLSMISKTSVTVSGRKAALLPTENTQTKTIAWPAVVARNIYLMAYDIAAEFEKKRIDEVIEKNKEELKAKKIDIEEEKKLNKKQQLVLIKTADGFTKYIKKADLKKYPSAKLFVPQKSAQAKAIIALKKPTATYSSSTYGVNYSLIQDQPSTALQIENVFQNKAEQNLKQDLKTDGLQVVGEEEIINGQIVLHLKSGTDNVDLSYDLNDPESNYNFQVKSGLHQGEKLSIPKNYLHQAFLKPAGGNQTVAEAIEDQQKEALQNEEALDEETSPLQPENMHPEIKDETRLPPWLNETTKLPGQKNNIKKWQSAKPPEKEQLTSIENTLPKDQNNFHQPLPLDQRPVAPTIMSQKASLLKNSLHHNHLSKLKQKPLPGRKSFTPSPTKTAASFQPKQPPKLKQTSEIQITRPQKKEGSIATKILKRALIVGAAGVPIGLAGFHTFFK